MRARLLVIVDRLGILAGGIDALLTSGCLADTVSRRSPPQLALLLIILLRGTLLVACRPILLSRNSLVDAGGRDRLGCGIFFGRADALSTSLPATALPLARS